MKTAFGRFSFGGERGAIKANNHCDILRTIEAAGLNFECVHHEHVRTAGVHSKFGIPLHELVDQAGALRGLPRDRETEQAVEVVIQAR